MPTTSTWRGLSGCLQACAKRWRRVWVWDRWTDRWTKTKQKVKRNEWTRWEDMCFLRIHSGCVPLQVRSDWQVREEDPWIKWPGWHWKDTTLPTWEGDTRTETVSNSLRGHRAGIFRCFFYRLDIVINHDVWRVTVLYITEAICLCIKMEEQHQSSLMAPLQCFDHEIKTFQPPHNKVINQSNLRTLIFVC